MHVHRFEKLWLVAAFILIVLFIGTVTYGAVGAGFGMVGADGGEVNPTNPFNSSDVRDPGVYKVGEDEYDVYVEARRYRFVPGTENPIEIPAGSTVTFHIVSQDVIHGFEVVGTNINTMAIPGQMATVTAEFDEPGTYGIVCNEYCGAAHHSMGGNMTVVPQSEFNATGTE
jgi:cytochrome c oxidase subunit 2